MRSKRRTKTASTSHYPVTHRPKHALRNFFEIGLGSPATGKPSTLQRFDAEQAYLRRHRPPTLIVWGVNDGYMPEASARAYLRDLPDADLHTFDGGHWLLETHLGEVVPLVREFLSRPALRRRSRP